MDEINYRDVIKYVGKMRSMARLLALQEKTRRQFKKLMKNREENLSSTNTDLMGLYAEWLVCDAMKREGTCKPAQSRVQYAVDLESGVYKKVQVKSRKIESDSSEEDSNLLIRIEAEKLEAFDYLVVVLFSADDYSVKKAVGMESSYVKDGKLGCGVSGEKIMTLTVTPENMDDWIKSGAKEWTHMLFESTRL